MKIDLAICSKRTGGIYSRRFCAAIGLLPVVFGLFGCGFVNQDAPPASAAVEQTSAPAAPRRLPEKIPAIRFPPRLETALKKSINHRLNAWQASIEARDIDKHLQFYADDIETYYLSANVGKDVVRADRERAFEQFDALKVQLINIDIYLQSKDEATVTFDKTWDFKKAVSFSNGLVQQEIKMRKIEKQWPIVSEKDLQIYRYRNS